MTKPLEPCLVAIHSAQSYIEGGGFLISDTYIVTCAHVVASVLNLQENLSVMPTDTVYVSFPMIAQNHLLETQVVFWLPPRADETGDIAILWLKSPLPEGAAASDYTSSENLWGYSFQALGFPNKIGASTYGTVRAKLPGGWIELESNGVPVEAGFSGSPVWNPELDSVIGIIVAERNRTEAKIAYMIPFDIIFNELPQEIFEDIQHYHLQRIANLYYGESHSMAEQTTVFVGRESELTKLQDLLDKGLGRQIAVCFVTGDPGTGKSSLVAEFARRTQERNEKIVFAAGQCNNQSGIGDPYLPFRQILTLLTGNVDDKRLAAGTITRKNAERLGGMLQVSGEALVEIAPELIGTLIPGGSLLVSLGKFALKRTRASRTPDWESVLEKRARDADNQRGDLDQTRIFEQYTALLKKLSEQTPLVLVLDDLQWADTASIAMLFHLSRELKDSPILIIGMYRPNEVDAGRDGQPHPLKKALTEIKIHSDKVWLDLNAATQQSGRAFVDALIDSEPNNLGEPFRAALFARTGGHALFTIELLRDLQERGALTKDSEGRWQVANEIDWNDLPDRVEGVIEERIGRLEEDLRELLRVASVEGQDFTAQVLGTIQELREKDLLKSLSQQLANRHRLVQETGEIKVGRTLLFRYAFSHALFHQYFYNLLGQAEKRNLHGEVAAALEALYEGRTQEIAAQLALHYENAGDTENAIKYLLILITKSRRVGALTDIVAICQHTLNLIDTPDTDYPEIAIHRASLYVWIGIAYKYLGKTSEAKQYIRLARETAEAINDADLTAHALSEMADILRLENEAEEARTYIQQAGGLLPRLRDKTIAVVVLRRWGIIERAITGDIGKAIEYIEQSLEIARQIDDKLGLVDGYNSLGIRYRSRGELSRAIECYAQGIIIAREQGDEFNESTLLVNLQNRRGTQRPPYPR